MSFLDLYEGDQQQTARIQPNEGTRLPTGFGANFGAAWSDGQMFGQSIARQNARAAVLDDYLSEIRQKTGNDIDSEMQIGASGPGEGISGTFDKANARIAKLKESYPDLDLDPLSEEEIDKRAAAKAQAARRDYENIQGREKGRGGSIGAFAGSAAASAADPLNILALAVAPETGGSVGILGAALRWGALAGASQAAIEASSAPFKEQVQPGYLASGQPFWEVAGAAVGGAVLGGSLKALGNTWNRVKTGAWPTVVRDAGNVIESEANVASTNILPGVEGEVAHREALTKTIDDVLAGNPVQVDHIITPEQAKYIEAWHGTPHDFESFDVSNIGTGEGAQSYGHGLYFAENEAVAGEYKAQIVRYSDPSGNILTLNKDQRDIAELLAANKGDVEATRHAIAKRDYAPSDRGAVLNDLETVKDLKPIEGNLYRVRINVDHEHILDWDKPISEQSDLVKDALAKIERENAPGPSSSWNLGRQLELLREHRISKGQSSDVDAGQFFELMEGVYGEVETSKMLSNAGVRGVKYLDQGSRTEGDGTRNFVIFDDKDVEITHKNGKPVNADVRQDVVDQAMGLPPREPELPLQQQPPEPQAVVAKKYTQDDLLEAQQIYREALWRTQQIENNPTTEKFAIEAEKKLDEIERSIQANGAVTHPASQTPEQMTRTLTDPAHQEAIRADIDRARATGDIQVPGVDENGKHTMVGVDAAMDEIDAYKLAAEQIQACANPTAEAAE
jgi:hypothetical protein